MKVVSVTHLWTIFYDQGSTV